MPQPNPPQGISRRRFLGTSALAAAGLPLATSIVPSLPAATRPPGEAPGTWPLVPYAAGDATYFADFSSAGAPAAFSDQWDRAHWRRIPFESDRARGVMIVAGQNSMCPELKLRLPVKGWHAIHFGLTSHEAFSRLEAKLSRDPAFALFTDHPMLPRLEYERGWGRYNTRFVQSYFWKYADLTDEEIILRQVRVTVDESTPDSPANLRHAGWLAYVKVVPLSAVEVRNLQADRARTDTRKLITTHDVTTPAAWLAWNDADDIRRELEPYRHTDFFRMDWEGGKGDLMHYPTRIGRTVSFEWQRAQFHSFEQLVGRSFANLQRKGIDPLRVALEHAHAVGLEFHASYRVSGFVYPPPRDERNTGGLFWRHPEWRGRDRAGKETPRLSYAHPGVRRWVVSLLREMAAYPIDGVTILYNRRPPVVEYEPPVVDSFRQKFGTDPRTLDEKDPRWLAHRATFVTTFMREVREAMDEISARERRKRIQVSAVVMGTEERNLYYGLDLRAWVQAGLVDWIIPYQSGDDLLSTRDSFAQSRDVAYFIDVVRGSGCRVAPNLMPREIPPEVYQERAAALYREGVHGLYFWDGYARCDYSDSWSTLRRLGHRDELDAWEKAGRPRPISGRDPLRRLGHWDMAYDSAS